MLGMDLNDFTVITSRWNIMQAMKMDCHEYIILKPIDVTALAAAFQSEVWYLIFATVLVFAICWSVVVRKSARDIACQMILSVLSLGSIRLKSQKFSSTILGCAALLIAFLIGQLYSNSVMSSFLDPTYKESPYGD